MDVSTMTVNRVINRIHNRILCDRMNNYIDSLIEDTRKQAEKENDRYNLSVYIMKAIYLGMSYSRIAELLHIGDSKDKYDNVTTTKEQKIAKMLKRVDDSIIDSWTIKYKNSTVPKMPTEYANGYTMKSTGTLKAIINRDRVNKSKAIHEKDMEQVKTVSETFEHKNKLAMDSVNYRADMMRKYHEYNAEMNGDSWECGTPKQGFERTNWNNNGGVLENALRDINRKIARRNFWESYQERFMEFRKQNAKNA